MDTHVGCPRYPWRFGEGTKIHWVGDAAWWWVINRLQKKIIRLPMVVGNYHSHPGEQAEFRKMPYDELRLLNEFGITRP